MGLPLRFQQRRRLFQEPRPNLVTWFLWTLNGSILAAAQYASGASWTLSVLVASTISTGIVTVLAIPLGQRSYGVLDGLCLVMALAAMAGWWTAHRLAWMVYLLLSIAGLVLIGAATPLSAVLLLREFWSG